MNIACIRVSLCALVCLAGSAAAQPLTTVRVANGLTLPIGVTHAPGDTTRMFIVEQRSGTNGRIKVLNLGSNTVNATPFLTVAGVSTGSEQGLLGLAFHPQYQTNGRFFVNYTTSGGGAAGKTVVAEYVASPPGSATANPVAVQTILQINQPETNHNGGWMGFGPDGYLYIATGDGGGGNDQHGTFGNGQNINVLLGKMLRIDVNGDDFPADPLANYAIPPSNPFAGATAGSDEIFHFGLRNSWRNSFDRLTGDMYIGDVGQDAWEEINFVAAGVGGLNFGWRCMEATHCTGRTGCTCNDVALTMPIHEYAHTNSPCDSTTGGYVYRGCAIPELRGTYFFADYCRGQIWSFRYDAVNGKTGLVERTVELDPPGAQSIGSISSFGEDAMGELYICDAGGEVFKIVPAAVLHDCNANGISDACDIAVGTSLDTNGDGRPDECCFADVDDNSFVNGDDYDAFAVWFFFGDPRADVDHNTFVNGDDFDAFYDAFFLGC